MEVLAAGHFASQGTVLILLEAGSGERGQLQLDGASA